MSQSEYKTIASRWRKARENARVQGAIGFGFGFHWMKKWREFCWPITELSNAKPKQPQFTFDAQLKSAISENDCVILLLLNAVMFYELLKETGLASLIILLNYSIAIELSGR